MNPLTVRLPESLHANIKALAKREGMSINQFIATAAAEKMAAILTVEYLREEAASGRRSDFEAYLAAVPDVPPQSDEEPPPLEPAPAAARRPTRRRSSR